MWKIEQAGGVDRFESRGVLHFVAVTAMPEGGWLFSVVGFGTRYPVRVHMPQDEAEALAAMLVKGGDR